MRDILDNAGHCATKKDLVLVVHRHADEQLRRALRMYLTQAVAFAVWDRPKLVYEPSRPKT